MCFYDFHVILLSRYAVMNRNYRLAQKYDIEIYQDILFAKIYSYQVPLHIMCTNGWWSFWSCCICVFALHQTLHSSAVCGMGHIIILSPCCCISQFTQTFLYFVCQAIVSWPTRIFLYWLVAVQLLPHQIPLIFKILDLILITTMTAEDPTVASFMKSG